MKDSREKQIPGEQLALRMWLREAATFAGFVTGANELAVTAVRHAGEAGERFVYLWGGEGVGKTHLLQAACHQATAAGESSVYLPMAQAAELAPEMLEGLEHSRVVAIDDVDAVAGDPAWEQALFHLYNRIRDEGQGALLVSASVPLASLGLELPDLKSRLAWGLVFQLQALSDEEKLQALGQWARNRGFDLSDEVGGYLLRHCRRDLPGLFELLERLDSASLAEQRRLTVPFVKEVIGAA